MTNRQIKICKSVIKHKNLNVVLQKENISDYIEIQDILGPHNLDFSDNYMDDNTVITLNSSLIEEVEEKRRRSFEMHFTQAIAVLALIISIISLLMPQ